MQKQKTSPETSTTSSPNQDTFIPVEASMHDYTDGLSSHVAHKMLEEIYALDSQSPNVRALLRPDTEIEFGDRKFMVKESQVVGAGGTKRVFDIPESEYVVAIPNTPGGYTNIVRWQQVVDEPSATREFGQYTGIPVNPDMYVLDAKIGGTNFPVLTMRSWASLEGTVLDAKNPMREGSIEKLTDPDSALDELKPILDTAIKDVDTLLSLGIVLRTDQLNLILFSDGEAKARLFATEVTLSTLDPKQKFTDYEGARKFMVARVIDVYLKHALSGSEYYKATSEWDDVVEKFAQSYGTTYYGR